MKYLSRRATGDEDFWWMDYVKARYATPPRRRGLSVGCGTGWVERELIDRGVAECFDAFDRSAEYLRVAGERRGARPIRYFQADFRRFRPEGRYDLIVNVAALHHVKYLYCLTHRLAGALAPDGIFVSWDYVGPSRMRYSRQHVRRMSVINATLPARFRARRSLRPTLLGALRNDPTEGVHASEILRAIEQYFELVESKELGGGIAYEILLNNIEEFDDGDPEAHAVLKGLLQADEELTSSRKVPNLFSFLVCRPRTMQSWRARFDRLIREPLRESVAWAAGEIYPYEVLLALIDAVAIVRRRVSGAPEVRERVVSWGEVEVLEGLYGLENPDDDLQFRWTGPAAAFRIRRLRGTTEMCLRCWAGPGERPAPASGSIRIDGKVAQQFELSTGKWHRLRLPLPDKPSPGGHALVEVVVTNPWTPPWETRSLGIAVRRIVLR